MCEHLTTLDNELKAKGLKETFRGEAWSKNCREWVYYDCVLDVEKIKGRYNFPEFITVSRNDDPKSGRELGLYCAQCHDAVMGFIRRMGREG